MEQHPVPQQISAYHFRLVGDMTIKQFLELAAGIIVAWIVYSLPVSGIIRWPLVIASVFVGVALAFLPLEERPLDRWIISFFKAVYSPTQFLWKKSTIIPSFFEEVKKQKRAKSEDEGVDQEKLKKYLETLPAQDQQSPLDQKESRYVLNILNMYMEVQPTTTSTIKPKEELLEEASLNVKIRKLKTPPYDPQAILRGEVVLPKKSKGKPRQINVPVPQPIEVEKLSTAAPTPQTKTQKSDKVSPFALGGISPTGAIKPKPKEKKASTKATVRTDLPIPSPPTEPNLLVGMVVDNIGNIVDNTIITIKDSNENVARALKTNKIGQFFIATPLDNGSYEIDAEHEGLSFDIIKIKLSGQAVPPIEIRAKP